MDSSPGTKQTRQDSGSMTAAEKVGSNPDLIGEILTGFSFKSLISCMLVSKIWYDFIKEKLSSHTGQTSGLIIRITPVGSYRHVSLVNDHRGEEVQIGINNLKFYGSSTISQSCNGLLLFLYNSRNYGITRRFKYGVYNMSSMKINFLHQPCFVNLICINLVRDPFGSPRYKVVAVCLLDRSSYEFYKIHIYSSSATEGEPGEWSTLIVGPFDSNSTKRFHEGVTWRDNVIWINRDPKIWCLCFNVSREEFHHIPSPPMRHPWNIGSVYLQESGGHLHFIELRSWFITKIDVFELENDFSRWFLKYHIDLTDQKLLFDHPKNFPFFLTLIQEIREDDACLVVYIPNQIISYSLKTKTCRKVCDLVVDIDKFQEYRWLGRTFIHHHSLPVFFSNSSNSRTANQAEKS